MSSRFAEFFAHYLRSKTREKPVIHAVCALLSGRSELNEFIVPQDDEPLSEAAHEAIKLLDTLDDDDKDAFLDRFVILERRMMPSRDLAALSVAKVNWLAAPLRNKEIVLGALLELRDDDQETVTVGMVDELLARVGRKLSNTSAFLRALQKPIPLVEILQDDAGKHGLLFKLTADGLKEAEKVRSRFHSRSGATSKS